MELLAIFVQNILPIFIVACIGFLIVRYLEADVRTLSRVTIYVLTPCLLFDVLVTSDVSADEFGRLTLLALGTILGIGLIAWLAARALRLDRVMTSAFMVVVMFANGGNYGLPLTLFVFGQEALARATIYFVVSIVLTYTIGIFLASSGRRSLGEALLSVLRIPSIYASAAAIVVIFHWCRDSIFADAPDQTAWRCGHPRYDLGTGDAVGAGGKARPFTIGRAGCGASVDRLSAAGPFISTVPGARRGSPAGGRPPVSDAGGGCHYDPGRRV